MRVREREGERKRERERKKRHRKINIERGMSKRERKVAQRGLMVPIDFSPHEQQILGTSIQIKQELYNKCVAIHIQNCRVKTKYLFL